MKIRDLYLGEKPTFETRLLYAMFTYRDDVDSSSADGYIDASRELLEGYKPIEELEDYINKYEATEGNNTEYDKAYILGYRDYILQEKKEEVTNE